MSSSTARSDFTYNEPNDRQAGTPVMTERWWRDRYNVIAEQGYRLRPQYNPQWVPSWFEAGGQATILVVRVVAFLSCPSPQMPQVKGGNGRDSHTRRSSSHA